MDTDSSKKVVFIKHTFFPRTQMYSLSLAWVEGFLTFV